MKFIESTSAPYRPDSSHAFQILQEIKNDVELVPKDYVNWWMKYYRLHFQRFLFLQNLLDDDDLDGRILEVGCVPGQLIILLKSLGFDVQGVDISPQRMSRLWDKYNINVDRADVERDTLPYPVNSFNKIIFSELIEHLRLNPLHALREVHRVLMPGGEIILTTPNIALFDRLRFVMGQKSPGDITREFRKLESRGHMGHFRLYFLPEITRMLDYVGFDIIETNYFGNPNRGKLLFVLSKIIRFKSLFRKSILVIGRKRNNYSSEPNSSPPRLSVQ